MQPQQTNRKGVLLGLAVFFVVAPLIAWFITPHYNPNKDRTAEEFYRLIQTYNSNASSDQKIASATIQSVKRVEDVWYILTVKSGSTDDSDNMLVADFYHDPKRMTILSLPYETALQKNISGIGVPYSVLSELNPELGGGSNE